MDGVEGRGDGGRRRMQLSGLSGRLEPGGPLQRRREEGMRYERMMREVGSSSLTHAEQDGLTRPRGEAESDSVLNDTDTTSNGTISYCWD